MLRRIARYAKRQIHTLSHSIAATSKGTYISDNDEFRMTPIHWDLDFFESKQTDQWLNYVSDRYMQHCFDLLGSGWVKVAHGMICRGLEGIVFNHGDNSKAPDYRLKNDITRTNYYEAKRIWSLVSDTYEPIDWHIDFKSGYRWPAKKWFGFIKYVSEPGSDIKVPWELGRMQHLPQLAMACHMSYRRQNRYLHSPDEYLREIRDQILDFIAFNPPGYGVQWRCPMDVAIRAANWCMTYAIIVSTGIQFDSEFKTLLAKSLASHARFIVDNMEWQEGYRGNHYLANMSGLLFISVFLDENREVNQWAALAIQEMISETSLQFLDDGANAEGSTSYHRLCAEMVIWSTIIISSLSEERKQRLVSLSKSKDHLKCRVSMKPLALHMLQSDKFHFYSHEHMERIEKMTEFMVNITRPDGRICQIGDNDSGRFFKLHPVFNLYTVRGVREQFSNLDNYRLMPDDDDYYMEDNLDCRGTVAAANVLFHRQDFCSLYEGKWLDEAIAKGILKNNLPAIRHENRVVSNSAISSYENASIKQKPADINMIKLSFPGEESICMDIEVFPYPDFGLFVYRSKRLYLAIRCGRSRRDLTGGHTHCDQLSIELNVDNQDYMFDPGSYLYTPLEKKRNFFRSVAAHNSPEMIAKIAPDPYSQNLFALEDRNKAQCLYFDNRTFVGRYGNESFAVERRIELNPFEVVIRDAAFGIEPVSGKSSRKNAGYSPGYGWLASNIAPTYKQRIW